MLIFIASKMDRKVSNYLLQVFYSPLKRLVHFNQVTTDQ